MRIEEFQKQQPDPTTVSAQAWNQLITEGVARGRALHGQAIRRAVIAFLKASLRLVRRRRQSKPFGEPVDHARAHLERPVVTAMDPVLDHPERAVVRQRRGDPLGLMVPEDRVVAAMDHQHR